MAALESPEDVDAVHVREAEIEEHQIGAHLVGRLEPLLAGSDPVDFDLVPGQHPRAERADVPFVVDDQDIVHSHKIAELLQPSPNFLPLPAAQFTVVTTRHTPTNGIVQQLL